MELWLRRSIAFNGRWAKFTTLCTDHTAVNLNQVLSLHFIYNSIVHATYC